MEKKEVYKVPFSHSLIAGGIAGFTEIILMYPLDVIKTRAQLVTGNQSTKTIPLLLSTIREQGFGTYRGILAPIMVEAPKRAVKFAANETYKPLFSKNGKLDQGGAILAGVSAGCTEACIVVPFELVKIRLQAVENQHLYKNTFDAIAKIAKKEGILSFYTGLESTLWRHGLWNGGYFGLINTLRALIPVPKEDSKVITMGRNILIGALAGTFGTILNTPADVVKTRIQQQNAGGSSNPPKYNWTLPSMVTIAKEEGFAALYKGFVPKVLRLGPGGGILYVVFDFVSTTLRKYEENKLIR